MREFSAEHREYFLPGRDLYEELSARNFSAAALKYKSLLYTTLGRYMNMDFAQKSRYGPRALCSLVRPLLRRC